VSKAGTVLACLVFAVPFGGVGVFASWAIGSTVHAAWRARSWMPVPATVQAAALHTSSSSDGGDTYRAEGSFRYAWEGRSYTGSQLGISAMGGSDNFDSWHQEVSSQLQAAREAGRPVTVWVNPENPAEAVFDRGLRWAQLLFLTPFAFAFGGVGVGALWVMVNVLRGKGTGSGGESAQRAVDRALGTSGKGGQASGRFLWIFAFFWNALAWPIAILALRDIVASGEWLGLLVLLFPLVGVLLVWGAAATSWKAYKGKRGGPAPARAAAPGSPRSARDVLAAFDRPAEVFAPKAASRLALPESLAEVEDTGATLSIRYRTRRRLGLAIALFVTGAVLSLVGVLAFHDGSEFWGVALFAIGALLDVSAVGMLVGRLAVAAKAGELTVERRTLAGTKVSRIRADQIRGIETTLSYSVNEEPYYAIVADLGAEKLTLGNSIPGEDLAKAVARRIADVAGVAR
jgi:hypothetical protein